MNIVCNKILLGINNKTTIFQQRRRHVNFHILAQEPSFHLIITPTALRIDSCQTLDYHLHTVWQLVHSRQTSFIFLAHHDTLILAQRVFAQPERHQCDTQRIKVNGRSNFHLSINDVSVHLGSRKYRGTSLGSPVQTLLTFHNTGDTKIAQYNFLMVLIAKEKVTRFDILVDNIVVMAVC